MVVCLVPLVQWGLFADTHCPTPVNKLVSGHFGACVLGHLVLTQSCDCNSQLLLVFSPFSLTSLSPGKNHFIVYKIKTLSMVQWHELAWQA